MNSVNATEFGLEEYKTLRQEVLTAMGNRISILTFGLASISLVLGASISKYTQDDTRFGTLFPALALSLAIPAIAIFVLFMWLGEYERMQRAGRFLTTIEQKINWEKRAEILTWKTDLRAKHHHMAYPYNATVMLLLVISWLFQMLGLLMLRLSTQSATLQIVEYFLALPFSVGHYALYRWTAHKIAKLHSPVASDA